MGQDVDRREPGKDRVPKKPDNNENQREKTLPKFQPARVVLKSSSSASKTTTRITLRTTSKSPPKSPWTMRDTPPSKKETSSASRHTISSHRSTPSSHTKAASPALRAKPTIREGTIRSHRLTKTGTRQQESVKTRPSAETKYERPSRRGLMIATRKVSAFSKADSDIESVLNPEFVSLHDNDFKNPNNTVVSSDNKFNIDTRIGDSPFYADEELSGDDLESRMRSFLRRRERNRVSRRSEIKAVKWDPAIVACGPLFSVTNNSNAREGPDTGLPQANQYDEPTKDVKTSLDYLNQIAADLRKADRRILQQLLEALKNVDSSDDTTVIRPKKKRTPLGEKQIKLMENYSSSTKTSNSQQNNKIILTTKKRLNPEAPVYQNFGVLNNRFFQPEENKENIHQGGKWPLNVQRKRPHSKEDESDIVQSPFDPCKPKKYIPPALRTRKTSPTPLRPEVEPIWVKTVPLPSDIPNHTNDLQQAAFEHLAETNESLIDAPLDPLYALQPPLLAQAPQIPLDNQPILPPSWMTGFQSPYQPLISQQDCPSGSYEGYAGFGFQPSSVTYPDWYLPHRTPVITMPLQHTQQNHRDKHAHRSDKGSKSRIKRLPPNVTPSETEPGRTAVALEPAWAIQVLDKFTAKYPWTGKVKPLPKLTKEKKFATKIQHKLEVLLLQQKEKKAMEEWFGPLPTSGLPRMVSEISSGSGLTDSINGMSAVS
ncbi:hypothetical protein WAI453_000412 [Rhynchosporium graminicola]